MRLQDTIGVGFIMLIVFTTVGFLLGEAILSEEGPVAKTHTIVSQLSDHDARCFILLDSDNDPVQMSCVTEEVNDDST